MVKRCEKSLHIVIVALAENKEGRGGGFVPFLILVPICPLSHFLHSANSCLALWRSISSPPKRRLHVAREHMASLLFILSFPTYFRQFCCRLSSRVWLVSSGDCRSVGHSRSGILVHR